jgi:putative spermidine/putrescine transport system permease protein
VAANFAGLPLAFAFIATLGRTGMATVLLRDVVHLDLYGIGFNLYSLLGLSLTYTYFQFPLMVLIIAPALDGLKREWREAAESLGATTWEYWRDVALPVLTPAILGAMILLFGNAFGAYATAFALTGGTFNFATILIGAEIRGDVLHNPGLGYAVALGMVVMMALSIAGYSWLQRATAKWVR